MSDDDTIKFTISQTMRGNIKEVKTSMEEWAAVLDTFYHHFEETIKSKLPENEKFIESVKDVYYDVTLIPIELSYVKRICDILGISFEEYTRYRDLLLRMDEIPKPRRKG